MTASGRIEQGYHEIERQQATAAAQADKIRQLAAELLASPIQVTDADYQTAETVRSAETARVGRITKRGGEFGADYISANPGGYGVDQDSHRRHVAAAAVSRFLRENGVEPTVYARLDFMCEVERLTKHLRGDRHNFLVTGL